MTDELGREFADRCGFDRAKLSEEFASRRTASTFARRSQVLPYVLEANTELVIPPNDTFCVAEMLDVTGICQTFDNLRGQVVAAKAALFSCVKMRDNLLQRHEAGELPVFVERASLFLHRATTGNVLVFVEDIVREECRLVHAVGFPRTHSGLRSCSVSSHDQQGPLFSDSLQGSSFKSYSSNRESHRELQRALWRAMLGCTHCFFSVRRSHSTTWVTVAFLANVIEHLVTPDSADATEVIQPYAYEEMSRAHEAAGRDKTFPRRVVDGKLESAGR